MTLSGTLTLATWNVGVMYGGLMSWARRRSVQRRFLANVLRTVHVVRIAASARCAGRFVDVVRLAPLLGACGALRTRLPGVAAVALEVRLASAASSASAWVVSRINALGAELCLEDTPMSIVGVHHIRALSLVDKHCSRERWSSGWPGAWFRVRPCGLELLSSG